MEFTAKNSNYHHLKNKWVAKNKKIHSDIWDKHQEALDWLSKNVSLRQLTVGSLGGLIMLTSSGLTLPQPEHLLTTNDHVIGSTDSNVILASKLVEILPKEVSQLNHEQERNVTQLLSDDLGFKVVEQLDGKRLNTSYGFMGGEQHLYRYPGDNLYRHADNASEWAMYGGAGIAPKLGAWGYFTSSEHDFSDKDKIREKYYIAVQTFLSAGFAENVGEYRDFFKFRKMLVVNPETGQAVVVVIGDAGPGESTGKHYGGSPEVMHELGLSTGSRKGGVLCFFIADPEDKIPLGPIKKQVLASN